MPRCEISISLYPRRTYYSSRETCRLFPVRTNEFVRVGHSRVTDDAFARVFYQRGSQHTYVFDGSGMGGAGSHVFIIAV